MKRMIHWFIVLIGLVYAAAIIDNFYLFVLLFGISTFYLVALMVRLSIQILILIFSEKYRRTFRVIIFLVFLFIYTGLVLNYYFFPKKYSPISLGGDLILFLFTLFLGWIIIRKKGRRTINTGISVLSFCLLIFLWLTYSPKIFGRINISETDALKSLPYAAWVPAGEKINYTGVTKYIPGKACNGINAYATSNLQNAYLVDMQAKALHTWSAKIDKNNGWYVIRVAKNGDLFGIPLKDRVLFKLDWDSRVKWQKQMIVHHDIAISEEGDIYVLSRKYKTMFEYGLPLPVIVDYVTVLSPDGKIKKQTSLYNVFRKDVPLRNIIYHYFYMGKYVLDPQTFVRMFIFSNSLEERLELLDEIKLDIFHNNNLEIIDRDIKGLCKKGNLLLSASRINLVAIVDLEKEKVVWKWGPGFIELQHNPSLLKNNNILIFDNGTRRGYSRILEVDPFTKQIVWEYKDNPPQNFFSPYQGSCQRLPNGNTLVCNSLNGYIFEVTKEGEKVWEFYNPEVDEENKQRATIYRFIRLTDPQDYEFKDKI